MNTLPAPRPALPPWARGLLWQAYYHGQSALARYAPLLFCLVDALRPQQAVVLGLGEGTFHFTLCQAIDKLELGAVCHGFGPQPAMRDQIAAYSQRHYSAISVITESADPARFPTGSVALMVIDLDHADRTRLTAWVRRLAAGGVLVIHTSAPQSQDLALLSQLSDPGLGGPLVRIEDASGLLVLAGGSQVVNEVSDLFAQATATRGPERILAGLIRRLGEMRLKEIELRRLERQLAATTRQVDQALAAESELGQAYEERSRVLAEKQVGLYRAEEELDRVRAGIAALHAELDQTRAEHAAELAALVRSLEGQRGANEAQIAALRAELAAGEAELAQTRAEHATELAALVRSLEGQRSADERQLAALQTALEQTRAGHATELAELVRSLEARQSADEAQISALQDDLAAHGVALDRLQAAHAAELAALQAAHAAELAALQTELADSRLRFDRTQAERAAELAALWRSLDDEQEDRRRHQAAREHALATEAADLRAAAADLERRLMAVHASTSWRLLEPARALVRRLTGKSKDYPIIPRF